MAEQITTEDVRYRFGSLGYDEEFFEEEGVEFDAWLAAHVRQVAERAGAQALRDAADDWPEAMTRGESQNWLNARADSLAPRPAAPGMPVTGVSAEQVRTGDGPCNMLNAHGPHRWDNRDTVNLRWKCPGVPVTDGDAL